MEGPCFGTQKVACAFGSPPLALGVDPERLQEGTGAELKFLEVTAPRERRRVGHAKGLEPPRQTGDGLPGWGHTRNPGLQAQRRPPLERVRSGGGFERIRARPCGHRRQEQPHQVIVLPLDEIGRGEDCRRLGMVAVPFLRAVPVERQGGVIPGKGHQRHSDFVGVRHEADIVIRIVHIEIGRRGLVAHQPFQAAEQGIVFAGAKGPLAHVESGPLEMDEQPVVVRHGFINELDPVVVREDEGKTAVPPGAGPVVKRAGEFEAAPAGPEVRRFELAGIDEPSGQLRAPLHDQAGSNRSLRPSASICWTD